MYFESSYLITFHLFFLCSIPARAAVTTAVVPLHVQKPIGLRSGHGDDFLCAIQTKTTPYKNMR